MRRIGAVLLVLALAACGNKPDTLNHAKLVDDIHTWAVKKEKADPSVKVDCPGDIEIKAGTEFHCLLRGGNQTARLTVTIENNDGYVTWVVG
jgi:hypothetical protein